MKRLEDYDRCPIVNGIKITTLTEIPLPDEQYVVFDGDIIKHTIASSSEKRVVDVKHIPSGRVKRFGNATEFKGRGKKEVGGWLGELNKSREEKELKPFLLEDFEIIPKQIPEPIENCLNNVKSHIRNVKEQLGIDKHIVVLGKGLCHRHAIPVPIKDQEDPAESAYKGNRNDTITAYHVENIEKYLIEHHNALVVEGVEADDYLAMMAERGYRETLRSDNKESDPFTIVTRDKDHYTVNGRMFDPSKMSESTYIDGFGEVYLDGSGKLKGWGRKWKYAMCLVGDSADNYFPSKSPHKRFRYGDKTVLKEIEELNTDKEMLEHLIAKYKVWVPEETTYESCFLTEEKDDWLSWLNKMWTFVSMLSYPGEVVDIRDEFNEYEVNLEPPEEEDTDE